MTMIKTKFPVQQTVLLACLSLILQLVIASRPPSKKSTYRRLHHDVFTNYSKTERPRERTDTTYVTMFMSPDRIIYLDDKRQSFKLAYFLLFTWYDLDLTWNKSEYGNITKIYRPQSDMWVPPVRYFNSLSEEKSQHFGYDENLLRIYSDGQVEWQMRPNEQFSCPINIQSYPFDVQTCPINFTLTKYTTSEVLLQMRSWKPVSYSDWFESGGSWEVLEFSCIERNRTMGKNGKFSMVTIETRLRRRKKYYMLTQILPLTFLSLTATAVFLLPAEAGEKIAMSITVLLSYAVYLSSISDQLPRTSLQWCVLQVYLMLLFAYTCAAIILAVVVLRIHHISYEIPVGPRMKSFVLKTRKWLCLNFVWKLKVESAENPGFGVDTNFSKNSPPDSTHTDHAVKDYIRNTVDSFAGSRFSMVDSLLPLKKSDTDTSADEVKSSASTQIMGKDSSHENLSVPRLPRRRSKKARRRRAMLDFTGKTLVTDVTWPRVAETVDRVFYIVFGISILFLTVFVNLYIAFSDNTEVQLSLEDRFPKKCSRE